MLADRMSRLEASGIRRIFDLMATMEDPINLSIGQAHFETPPELVEAACRAMRDGHNGYTTTRGLATLNEKILDSVEAARGARPESSMVTSGASGGILLAFLALLDPGDEILLPDPYFVVYRHLANLCGAKIVPYDLYPHFHLDPAQIAELVTEKTKVIFLNSPGNPTGGVLSAAEIAAVVEVADRFGALVISDEIYDAFVYDGDYSSPVGMTERVLQISGFGKAYGMAGWRMGFATGPAELLDAMAKLQQYTFVCAPAPLQHAVAEAAFDVDMKPRIDEYRQKRDMVVAELDPAFRLVSPGGSFYAFPELPGRASESAFLEAALARNLLVVPGSAFSQRSTHFRVSFAAPDDVLRTGIGELNDLARQFAP